MKPKTLLLAMLCTLLAFFVAQNIYDHAIRGVPIRSNGPRIP